MCSGLNNARIHPYAYFFTQAKPAAEPLPDGERLNSYISTEMAIKDYLTVAERTDEIIETDVVSSVEVRSGCFRFSNSVFWR